MGNTLKLVKHKGEREPLRNMIKRHLSLETSHFLSTLEGVIDASAWFQDGVLHAHISVLEDSNWTVPDIKNLCQTKLSNSGTPQTVLILKYCHSGAVLENEHKISQYAQKVA